jgi:hypothetical protein
VTTKLLSLVVTCTKLLGNCCHLYHGYGGTLCTFYLYRFHHYNKIVVTCTTIRGNCCHLYHGYGRTLCTFYLYSSVGFHHYIKIVVTCTTPRGNCCHLVPWLRQKPMYFLLVLEYRCSSLQQNCCHLYHATRKFL